MLSSLYSNRWKEGLCFFGCSSFKSSDVVSSMWCPRLSGYFWTLQVDIFVLSAHLEHQLLLYWFIALAFLFKLIRGKLRDVVLFPFWSEEILTLLTRQLSVQCFQVWYLCMSDGCPWKHLTTQFPVEWQQPLMTSSPCLVQQGVDDGCAVVCGHTFQTYNPQMGVWFLYHALMDNQFSLLSKSINGSP